MAIDLQKLEQKFDALFNDPNFVTDFEQWLEARSSSRHDAKLLVTCCCMVCGKDFQGEEPKMCCSGRECGCMGMPIEPVVCSDECYDKLMSRNNR